VAYERVKPTYLVWLDKTPLPFSDSH